MRELAGLSGKAEQKHHDDQLRQRREINDLQKLREAGPFGKEQDQTWPVITHQLINTHPEIVNSRKMDRQQHIVEDRANQSEHYETRRQNKRFRNTRIASDMAVKEAEHDRAKTDQAEHPVTGPVYPNAFCGNEYEVHCAQNSNDRQNKTLITREYHQRPQSDGMIGERAEIHVKRADKNGARRRRFQFDLESNQATLALPLFSKRLRSFGSR